MHGERIVKIVIFCFAFYLEIRKTENIMTIYLSVGAFDISQSLLFGMLSISHSFLFTFCHSPSPPLSLMHFVDWLACPFVHACRLFVVALKPFLFVFRLFFLSIKHSEIHRWLVHSIRLGKNKQVHVHRIPFYWIKAISSISIVSSYSYSGPFFRLTKLNDNDNGWWVTATHTSRETKTFSHKMCCGWRRCLSLSS